MTHPKGLRLANETSLMQAISEGCEMQALMDEVAALKAEIKRLHGEAYMALCSCYNMWQDECWTGHPDGVNVEVVGFFRPYYDRKLRNTKELSEKFAPATALKGGAA